VSLTRNSLVALVATCCGIWLAPVAGVARAGVLQLKSCSAFGDSGNATDVDGAVWQSQGPIQLSEANRCQQGGSFQILPDTYVADGANAQWHTVTPPTIGITGAFTPLNDVLVEPPANNQGFQASYFWNGGLQSIPAESNCCGGMDYGLGVSRNDIGGSRYFGFQVSCQSSSGCEPPINQLLDVKGIQLTAVDNTPPTLIANSGTLLWEAGKWVRGVWPINFVAADDSGVCDMGATIDARTIQGPSATPNQSSWTQCPTPQTMAQSINTASYGDGPLSLVLAASDAATPANVGSSAQTVDVDNSPVTVAVNGPADALSTAGTQYVQATASAGPSGVKSINCSVDGAPDATYPGSSAQIPVAGVGAHTVQCYAENNAVDTSGTVARSSLATWNMSIRQPTVSSITFGTRLVDALRCRRVEVRVHTKARWVTVRVAGQRVRVHLRAKTHVRHEVHCHARVAIRKIRVRGRTVRRRVVLLPHRVQVNTKRVRFGRATTVGGWAGLADGTALPGVQVRVITATDNGRNRWRQAGTATTNADGLWQAKINAGPSRLVAAVYAGSGTTEPASSGTVTVLSPARVALQIRPSSARWGHTIRISGRVLGGNIPAGKLLRLRIGTEGIYSTVGIPDLDRDGRYHTTWTFAPGHGRVRYWFSVSTLPEADYPYTQTSSPRVYVAVHR
jgi:hypothetical protein